MRKDFRIVFSDGTEEGGSPVAVASKQVLVYPVKEENIIVDPILTYQVTGNLYGRIMTLIEATTDKDRLEAVKSVFGKELSEWESHVFRSANQIVNGNTDPNNIYLR